MSIRILTKGNANNAQLNLSAASKMFSAAVPRLSSGLRITAAGAGHCEEKVAALNGFNKLAR